MSRYIQYEATFPTEQEGLVAKFPFRRTYIVHTENELFLCTNGDRKLFINFYSLFDVVKKYPTAYRWKLTTIENGKTIEECLIYIRSEYILREVPEIRQIAIAENDTYERTHILEYEIQEEIYERRKD